MKYYYCIFLIVFFGQSISGQLSVKAGIAPQGYLTFYTKRVSPSGVVELEYWISPLCQLNYKKNEIEVMYSQSYGFSKVNANWAKRSGFSISYSRIFLADYFHKKWRQDISIFTKIQGSTQNWMYNGEQFEIQNYNRFKTLYSSLGINFTFGDRFELQVGWGRRFFQSSSLFEKHLIISYKLF